MSRSRVDSSLSSRPDSRIELAGKCLLAAALATMLTACGNSSSTTPPPAGPGLDSVTGNYVFQVSGANSDDGDYTVVGSFVADGKGNISSAVADYNLGSGVDPEVPLTGTYTVSGSTATINLTDGGAVRDSFTTTVGAATMTAVQNFDGSGSGTLYKQSASGFTLPGTYSFSVSGEGQGTITGSGQFVAGATGSFTSGNLTFTDAQTSQTYASVTGFLSPPQTSGRGQASLVGSNLAYYVVGPNQLIMLGLDERNLLLIPAQKQ